jgi:hypothetical protein
MVVTKKLFPRFKYNKSKVEEYQFALTVSLGNLWVVDLIGHLGADGLVDLLQQCAGVVAESTFGSKLLGGSCKERHYHKLWFDADCRIVKRELRLWLKTNPDSHDVKHQESKLKNLLKREKTFWETIKVQHMCVLAKVDALLFWTKYRARAPIVDKINVATPLESFRRLVGQSLPPIQLQIDYSAQVTEPPPSHTLNTSITFIELLQALKKLQRNKAVDLDGMKAEFIFYVEERYTCHY